MRFPVLLAAVLTAGRLLAAEPAAVAPAAAPASDFALTLSPQDFAGAGLAKLSADELVAFHACVAREVAAARAGRVSGFAGTFISRRTAAERTQIGLDRLSPAEQENLNLVVARAIAAGATQPDVSPELAREAVVNGHRLQVHGEVSLTVGGDGHGHSFYGTSFSTTVSDPVTGLTVGVGYDQYKGKGWLGYGPDGYYYDPDLTFVGRGDCFRRH